MDRLRTLFLKNTGLKIISLFIAILLWIVSMNLNNPQMTQTYTVPLQLLNLSHVNDSGMVVLNEEELINQEVYIKIKATRNDLITLDESRVTASIDFSPVDVTNSENVGQSVPVTIYVSVPSIDYEIVDYSPRTVNIVFDELTTKDVPIEIVQNGTPASNYEITSNVVSSPEVVTIKGAKSDVETVEKAIVNVNLEGATAAINEQYPISIIDYNGEDITSKFSLSSQSTNVTIPIDKIDSMLVGSPTWEGDPAEGYNVVDVTWSLKYVDVVGDEEVISSLAYIELPPINVTGATGDVTEVIDLNEILEPYGLAVQSGSESKCTVTVEIEETVKKIIEIPTSNIVFTNITDEERDSLNLPETFEVIVTGPASEITNLDPNSIKCTADFENYTDGDDDIEVDVSSTNSLVTVESPVRLRVGTDVPETTTEGE